MIDLKMLESASLMLNAYADHWQNIALAKRDPSDAADARECAQDATRVAQEVRKALEAVSAMETGLIAVRWRNEWVFSREPGSATAWHELQEWVKARESEAP